MVVKPVYGVEVVRHVHDCMYRQALIHTTMYIVEGEKGGIYNCLTINYVLSSIYIRIECNEKKKKKYRTLYLSGHHHIIQIFCTRQ